MVWKTAEKKIIGTVSIIEEGEVVPPVVPPVPDVVKDFVKEHVALKKLIDNYGKKGQCVTKESLIADSKLSVERLNKHLEVFKEHDVIAPASGDTVCGREAIRALKKQLEVNL